MKRTKELFRKYDYYTLDSLLLLLEKAGESHSKLYTTIDSVCDEKYLEEEFDGRNEFDYINRVKGFNLNKIIEDADMVSNKDFKTMYGIILSSYKKIVEKMKETKSADGITVGMCEQLEVLVDKCENRSIFASIIDKLDSYDKFVVRIVMEYAADYYEFTEEGVKILDRMLDYDCVFLNHTKKSLSNLSKKELDILLELTEDADGVLDIEFNKDEEAKRKIVQEFLNRIEKALEDRKGKGSKKYRP